MVTSKAGACRFFQGTIKKAQPLAVKQYLIVSYEPKEQSPTESRSFRQIFCERTGCRPEQFEEKLFQKCLYSHAVYVAPVIRIFDSAVFKPDFELIKHAATTTSLGELERELDIFRWYFPPMGFWRRVMNVRMSGRLLLNVGKELFQ